MIAIKKGVKLVNLKACVKKTKPFSFIIFPISSSANDELIVFIPSKSRFIRFLSLFTIFITIFLTFSADLRVPVPPDISDIFMFTIFSSVSDSRFSSHKSTLL